MAMVNSKSAAMFLNLALVLSLLFIFTFGFKEPTLNCEKVYGVEDGDTCTDVTERFKLTAGKFADLNPNLVCEKLFIGQWLCVRETV